LHNNTIRKEDLIKVPTLPVAGRYLFWEDSKKDLKLFWNLNNMVEENKYSMTMPQLHSMLNSLKGEESIFDLYEKERHDDIKSIN
jgi:hypothetical protein